MTEEEEQAKKLEVPISIFDLEDMITKVTPTELKTMLEVKRTRTIEQTPLVVEVTIELDIKKKEGGNHEN